MGPGRSCGVAGQAGQLFLQLRQMKAGGRGDPAIAAVDVVRRWWQGSFPVCRSLTGSGV